MKYFLLLSALLFTGGAFTSQEGVLALDSFQLDSKGIGSSGPVKVKGSRDSGGGFESITVEAFGKTLKFPKDDLKKIPRSANGIQLSFENGYKELGGKTIYLTFFFGFTSLQKEKVTLSIKEDGKSSIVEN